MKTTTTPQPTASSPSKRRSRGRRVLLIGGLLAAGAAAGVARRRLAGPESEASGDGSGDDERHALGWGERVAKPEHQIVRTPDGAQLAVWDLPGDGPEAPVVVLPHCWGCSHEIWIPVARRLREQGHRVVLYDQRGHGASTRGTAPLALDTLAHDLEAVLDATDVSDVVLAGHSMGGMTVMALATYRPDVLRGPGEGDGAGRDERDRPQLRQPGQSRSSRDAFIGSPLVSRALLTKNGHLFVRNVFGTQPVRAHMELTRDIFANCDGRVRGDFVGVAGDDEPSRRDRDDRRARPR